MKDYTLYVTKKIANKAIKKGFRCNPLYYSDEVVDFCSGKITELPYRNPSASQILDWLKEEKGIDIDIHRGSVDNEYEAEIYQNNKMISHYWYRLNKNETILASIEKALKTI